MIGRKLRVALAAFSLAALVAAGVAGQFYLRSMRPASAPVLTEGPLAALGALRSLAAEVVWFRMDRLQDEGRYVELAQLASTLTLMEPHTPEVWSHAAWNLAYNVSVMMNTPEERWHWVDAAIRLLRDEGIALNPREPELYRELAWLFEIKLGTNIDSAAAVYREKWKAIVSDVQARGAWQEELRMDPKRMLMTEQMSGMDDWTDPLLSAIYWALLGGEFAEGREQRLLHEIARQSKLIHERNIK